MLIPDFKELPTVFNALGVEYLLGDGYAMAVHGHPRYTGGIDLLTEFDGVILKNVGNSG